jgi:hypothetical protein
MDTVNSFKVPYNAGNFFDRLSDYQLLKKASRLDSSVIADEDVSATVFSLIPLF